VPAEIKYFRREINQWHFFSYQTKPQTIYYNLHLINKALLFTFSLDKVNRKKPGNLNVKYIKIVQTV